MSCIGRAGTARPVKLLLWLRYRWLTWRTVSIGLALIDTLDAMVHEGRIEPQLAMKIVSTFDRVITEVLADKVKARLTFKVLRPHVSWLPMVYLLNTHI